jgi:hypothetical protein
MPDVGMSDFWIARGSGEAEPMPAGSVAAAVLTKVEAEMMYRAESGAPAQVPAEMGMASARIGGGSVLVMRRDVTEYRTGPSGLLSCWVSSGDRMIRP